MYNEKTYGSIKEAGGKSGQRTGTSFERKAGWDQQDPNQGLK